MRLLLIIMFLLATSASNATATEFAASTVSALFGGMAAFMAFFAIIWIVVILLVLVNLAVTVWGIYDVLTSRNDSNWKLLWVVIILFANLIGVLLYYFMGRKERKK